MIPIVTLSKGDLLQKKNRNISTLIISAKWDERSKMWCGFRLTNGEIHSYRLHIVVLNEFWDKLE